MKKLFSLILVLSLSLSNISFSYAWPFGLFEKKTEEKKSSSSLGELVEEYAKKVKVNINLPKKNEQDKYANYISVTSHELSKAGKYNIILKYNEDTTLANINIEIIPNKEAYYLAKENGNIIDNNEKIKIGKEEHIKLIMADKYQNLIQNLLRLIQLLKKWI